MKVLLINNFHYRKGGSETVYFETGRTLAAHGHQVIYFSLADEQNEEAKYHYLFPKRTSNPIIGGVNYFYNWEAKRNLQRLLELEKPDIAHIHLIWGGLSASILKVLKKNNIPIVHTAHDQRMICPAYIFRNGKDEICEQCKPNKYYRCIWNKCSKKNRLLSSIMAVEMYVRNAFFNPIDNIDGFLFVSRFSESKHIEFNPRFLRTQRLQIYNFTNGERDCIIRKGNYYLYYGRLSEEKGINTLINSFKGKKDLLLYIVGTGPLKDNVTQTLLQNDIRNIKLLGFKRGEELHNLIKNAKCVIVPSECYENNPMTVIESYSYSTPVIGAHIGGVPEIIDHEKTGYTFESGNTISLSIMIDKFEALSDDDYSKFAFNAHKFYCDNFETEGYYSRLIAFYKQIISNYKERR